MASTEEYKLPAGPKGHWLLGNMRQIQRDPIRFTAQAAWDHGPVAQIRFANRKLYITADADCVREIFLASTENYCKGNHYERLKLLGGNGLITSEGDFWKRQRRLAQPGFHKEKLHNFIQAFIDCSYDIYRRWEQMPTGEIIPLAADMSELTLRIVGKTLFSIELAKEAASVPPDVRKLLRFLNIRNYTYPRFPMRWPLPSHTDYKRRKKNVDTVVYSIIDQRREGHTQGDDLLSIFLDTTDMETGEKMERDHIRDEILTLFLAGYETSSVALTWIWYLLHKHPEVHARLNREIAELIGNGSVTPAHIMQLEYARQVVNEALRLYPPVFTIPRQVAREHILKGIKMEQGQPLLISVYGLHHHPEYWPDPETFDPDRFAPENQAKLVKNAYIPFGAGQRLCIGNQFAVLEIISALAVLAPSFKVKPKPGYAPDMIAAITTNISQGMPVSIMRYEA